MTPAPSPAVNTVLVNTPTELDGGGVTESKG